MCECILSIPNQFQKVPFLIFVILVSLQMSTSKVSYVTVILKVEKLVNQASQNKLSDIICTIWSLFLLYRYVTFALSVEITCKTLESQVCTCAMQGVIRETSASTIISTCTINGKICTYKTRTCRSD